MPRTGRPPVPIERKRALGNPGKRPIPEAPYVLPAEDGIPEPDHQLGRAGMMMWERIWTAGKGWISQDVDIFLVLMVCDQADERTRLRRLVWDTDDPKHRKALRELERQIRETFSLLGFTPTDRARLGLAEIKKMTKIEELREQQAQRAVAAKVRNNSNSR